MPIRILEQDGNVVEAELGTAVGPITVIASVQVVGGELVLYDLHLDSPGSGTLGVHGLRTLVDDVMEFYGVERIAIHGFRRTTGATPGRIPAPLRFRRHRRSG